MDGRGIAFRLTNKTDFFTLHSVDGYDKHTKVVFGFQRWRLVLQFSFAINRITLYNV
jgi:hypothetical protein